MPEKKENIKTSSSRREFIKTGAVVAAGLMIVPRFVLGGKGYIAPSDKLIIASVGVGGKGGDDVKRFNKVEKADIAFLRIG